MDQIIIGVASEQIREEALKKSWSLNDLRKEGMHMESAAKGASEIAGEGSSINRVGRYSMKGIKNNTASTRKVNCYFCGMSVNSQDITKHANVLLGVLNATIAGKLDIMQKYVTLKNLFRKSKRRNRKRRYIT